VTESWIPAARARLKRRGETRPQKTAGQIRALWPAIQSAIANGQTQKQICDWLNEEGVRITCNALRVYLSRIRKERREESRDEAFVTTTAHLRTLSDAARPERVPQLHDPLANLRERQENRPGFSFDPEIKPEKLI
jgi:uncharacterized protein (DUF2267 family)